MTMSSENQFRLIEGLKSPGLTKYEALVSIGILKVMRATATEIHGSSGVPRASFCPVIGQLLDRPRFSLPSIPKRFAAIPPEEAIAWLRVHFDRDADYAPGNSPAIHNGRMRAGQGAKN